MQLIGKLGAQLEAKKKELAAFQEKFKIRVRQNVRRAAGWLARCTRRCFLRRRALTPRPCRAQEPQSPGPGGSAGGAGVLVQGSE